MESAGLAVRIQNMANGDAILVEKLQGNEPLNVER
jgi:hypothetical protein